MPSTPLASLRRPGPDGDGGVAILKVARLGHPVLRQPARDLTPEEIRSPAIAGLVDDMRATMAEYSGVGLAAPQVHEPLRIALIEFGADNDRYAIEAAQPLLVVFNARVTVLDETRSGYWEGCLSVPGLRGYVEQSSTAEGFLATVFQHELDHLEGILYVDRVKDPAKLAFVEEYVRYHQVDED